MEDKKAYTLTNDDFFDIEQIIKKIAKDNNIGDVENVTINLTANEGMARFKIAKKDDDDDKDDKKDKEKDKEEKGEEEEKEEEKCD